ncbi:MAG: restriction endonuclease subunit S [Candidatus Accumulibacter sp.]|uniref:restriction endonuclease subunit S n=1 Tax=Accumulibacter sp. TaxID=2053492 RepID=UPI002590EBFC|nr:restriction endonuclease subunit S [Accumulibacter sp.]MBK8114477.1 restriction endonuclease subunit S [Accumulibacter sp.]
MSSEWPLYRIEDIAERVGMGPFGSSIKVETFVEEGIPIISGEHLHDVSLIENRFRYITSEHAERLAKSNVFRGDVVFTHAGTIGQVSVIPANSRFERYVLSQRQFFLRCHRSVANPPYYFKTPEGRHKLLANASQVGVPSIARPVTYLRSIEIPIPPIAVQDEIVAHIEALRDRISLLRETNATLEAIAQALFKSWFVDFDPVRAKQEGRAPEGMDEATAALFPDGFEESELGLVPRGWRVGALGESARLHKGTINPLIQPDVVFEHYSLPAFDTGQMPVFEAGSEIKSNKTTVPADAVLLSKLNPHIPRIWLPSDAGKAAVCSTEFLVFVPTNGESREFVFCQFSTAQFQQSLCQLVTGTSNSHQRVKPDGVLAMPTAIPVSGALAAFCEIAKPLFGRIGHNRHQAQTLATLRDTLLPRLISGQLRLPAAETLLAEFAA